MKLNKYLTYLLIPLILWLIVFLNIYPWIIAWWDNELVFLYPKVFIEKWLYLWNVSNSFWAFFSITQNLPLYFLYDFFRNFISYNILNILFFVFSFIWAYCSIIYLLKTFNKYELKNSSLEDKYTYAILWLIYVGNYWFLQLFFRGINFEILSFVLMPLCLSFYIKYVNWEKKYILSTLLVSLFLSINIAHLLVFLFLMFLFSIIKFKKYFIKWLIYFSIILVLSSFWLIPMISTYIYSYADISTNKYIVDTTVHAEFSQQLLYHTYLNIFQNLSQWLISNFNYPIDRSFMWFLFNFVLIFIIIFTFLIGKKDKENKKYSIYFLFLYLLIIQILLWANWYFWEYFTKIILDVPWMIMFRSIHTKFNYIILILLVFLIYLSLKSEINFKIKKYLKVLLLFYIFFTSYWFAINLFDHDLELKIPTNYINWIHNFNNIAKKEWLRNWIILPNTYLQWQSFTNWWFWWYSFFQQSSSNIWYHTVWTTWLNSNNFDIFYKYIISPAYDFDLKKLSLYGFDFFIIQKDFKYNYNESYKFDDISKKLDYFIIKNKDDLVKIYEDEYFYVMKIKWKTKPIINSNSISFQKHNPTKYIIDFKNISSSQDLSFLQSFHKEWKLYLKPNQNDYWCNLLETYNNDWNNINECKNKQTFFEWEELSYLNKVPIFDNTHKMFYGYANWWTISKDEIINYVQENSWKELQKWWYPKKLSDWRLDYKYYVLNSDWSIDTELTLYFKPQSYFYLWIIISSITILVILLYFIIENTKNILIRKHESK